MVIVDLCSALAGHGREVAGSSVRVLGERPGRVVAYAETTSGPVVVKASAEAGAFVREEAAIRRLAAHGLPVASVIGHDLGPPAYLVLAWTDGDPLSSASPPRAQRALGELLRRVHAIGPRPDRDDSVFPGGTTWNGWMAGWLNTALGWWSGVDPSGYDRVRRAWAWFHRLRPLLANRGHELILFDGRPEHLLVRGDEVGGLIDVAELRTGDAAMDLGVLAVSDPALLTGVLAGYRPTAGERDVFSRLVPFYTFLRRISHAEWQQRFGTAAELTQALSQLDSTEIPP